jgi:anaerobic magnesium-protoporphyrin IX monomethyl ester cyclase
MQRICLVNPRDPICEDNQWDEPLGLMYLGAILERFNYPVEIIDMNFHKLNRLDEVKADWFGLYCSSSMVESARIVNNYIKMTHPDTKTMVGGPHATCMPNDFIGDFNKIVVGEGEMAILSIFDSPTSQIIQCPPITNLDILPFPARHLLPIHDYHRRVGGKPSVGLMTSRGCPNRCSFCSKVWGTIVRFRSADNVIGEVKECINEYGINAFNIRDDTFTLNRSRLYKMLDGFSKMDVVWRCLTRVDQVNEQTLEKMASSGCTQIVYGLESGNQHILDVLGKRTTVEQNLKTIKMTKEAGIEAKAAVIVGNSGETWDTVRDTVSMIEECMPDSVILCTFTPYPGSPVWDDPDRFKMKILTRDVSKYMVVGENMHGNVVVETERMTAQDIADAHDYMLNRFKELGLIK